MKLTKRNFYCTSTELNEKLSENAIWRKKKFPTKKNNKDYVVTLLWLIVGNLSVISKEEIQLRLSSEQAKFWFKKSCRFCVVLVLKSRVSDERAWLKRRFVLNEKYPVKTERRQILRDDMGTRRAKCLCNHSHLHHTLCDSERMIRKTNGESEDGVKCNFAFCLTYTNRIRNFDEGDSRLPYVQQHWNVKLHSKYKGTNNPRSLFIHERNSNFCFSHVDRVGLIVTQEATYFTTHTKLLSVLLMSD